MSADETDAPETPPCSACRGTGRVISRLGGTDHEIECPWCEGGGKRLRDHDAQAARLPEGNGDGDDGPDLAA